MMRGTSATAVTVAATLLLGACLCVAGERLNQHVSNYAGINIHPQQTLYQGRYTRETYLHDQLFTLNIAAFDSTFRFDLEPHTSLHSPDLKAYVFAGEERTEVSLDDRKYYRGHVNFNTSEFCHFRVADDGTVHGFFNYDGDKYAVDPAEYHFDEPQEFNHVVYRLSDHDYVNQPQLPAHCGVTKAMADQLSTDEQDEAYFERARRAAFDSSKTVCNIGIVADSLFYTNLGGSNVGRTIDKMTQRFANVEEVYEEYNTVRDDSGAATIGISIGYLEVISTPSNDPYNTGQNFNNDGSEFLRYFSKNPNAANNMVAWDDYCIVHCLTDQEFNDGLLGLAWVGSADNTPGGICQQGAKLSGEFLYTNTGFSTQTNFGARVPDLTAYLVMAHEMGHNFGSGHDEDEQTSGGQYLMWPVSVDGTEDNNYLFSPQSLDTIAAVITAKGGCFVASDEPTCGNTVQEGTEQCDCGSNEDLCSSFDACCTTDCMLAAGKECSPQHRENGACCNDDCTKITDTSQVCREETVCTMQSTCTANGECPASVARVNNTVCASDMLCNDGVCARSICYLWGLQETTNSDNPCLVYCYNTTLGTASAKTTDQLGSPTVQAKNQDGTDYTVPSSAIARAVGSLCRTDNGTFTGQCSDTHECESNRGTTYFDDFEDFLKNASFNDLKEWALRTDAYIPNWGWLLVGLGVLIILISLCCCLSNRMDKSNKVV
ncbi:hypothetical protein PTSG_01510 [Salpingoeca rosetta]|uniref:Disintegrin and metalloproteinase domain-containing protein 10 n=1 Tax=Salpingoeca rosetta (strain ATCC 50818 / BSB-021) TaxID=946362 RepID=F2U0J8_SALR5|nr:uncharacterized protein PTSG_01510 [Salpingoeca rosetta]EGD80926.1 hypothetical protein PTSG_01510 [Salpingoeca rosetta]|eukprot:XP_004997487.1 hypothetical protein PTSG_01510 [Salpingoeca rosetta]